MLHGSSSSSSRRFLLAPQYNHLLSLSSYRAVFSRRISTTQTQPSHYNVLDSFDHLLRQCTTTQQTQQIHTQIVLFGASHSAFLATRLISMYSRFGVLNDARKVFGEMPVGCNSNLLLWNSILRANVTHGEYQEAISVYIRMRNFGVRADGYTFPLVIKACAVPGRSQLCSAVHSHVLKMGLQNNLHVANELLGMYGKLGRMSEVLQMFDKMSPSSYISWNTVISGFSINHDCVGALEMFRRMELEGWEPNLVTWTSLLSSHARCGCCEDTLELYGVLRRKGIGANAETLAVVISVCADSDAFLRGVEAHGHVVRAGFGNCSFVKNSLISMYGKHGATKDAENVFLEIESKDLVSWNSLISCYAESGLCEEALALFSQLKKLDGYPVIRPNVITWSSVICGFSSSGHFEESLGLFREMQLAKVMHNSATISILSVCAELSALVLGKEIHAHVIRGLMDRDTLVGNGLVNMYTKCGTLKEAHLAFEKIDGKDLFSWNTIISGYGMHGLAYNAIKTFDQIIEAGYKPDGVTFVAVLSACGHAGFVAEGRNLFEQMTKKFRIEPQVQHYACMVDLLGRAGLLQEASSIVKNMPMEPNACVLGSLLNSCRMYKNTNIAEETASHLLNLYPAMSGSYSLLSNIYAASARWEDAARVRILAKTRGIKKVTGQSWIVVNKEVNMFSAGNAEQRGEEVYWILKILSLQMEMEGYEPDKRFMLQNVDEVILG